MKKTNFSFKSLLVAAGLLIGSANAWATDVPYSVGTSTAATYLSAYSDVWEMSGDGVLEVTFTNHCKTDAGWAFNWHLICGNATDLPSDGDVNTNRYFVMRADRWDNVAGSAAGFWVSDNYWTDFMTYQNDATVNLKVVRYGTTVNVYSTITKDDVEHTMGYVKTGIPDDETIKFYLTGSESYMEITAQSLSTDVSGEVMTNAFMSFTNATITSKTITGEVGSMSWGNEWTSTPSIDTNMLRVGNMNDGTVALVGEAAGAKDIVTISFDLAYIGLQKKEVQFKVTDVNDLVLVDEKVTVQTHSDYPAQFTANTLGFDLSDFVWKAADNPGIVADTKNTFTLTLNYATGKISGSVTNKNGTVNKQIDMPVGAAAVASFAVRSNYNNENRRCYFDNLKITTEIGNYAATSTTYKVKYKSGGEEIKDEATGRIGDVGANPVLEPSDLESFYSADSSEKYVYADDDASTTTIEDGGVTVVTVNFTTYKKRTYTLNAVDNEDTVLGELATGYVYADDPSVTVNIPWYVLYNNTLYHKNSNSTSFNVTTNGQTSTVEYTITDKTNVAFYSEGEKLLGVTTVTNNIASNKGIARIPNETTYTNLGAGSYTVYVRAHSGNTSAGTAIFKAGEVEFARKGFAGSTNNQDFNASFALLASTDMKIQYDCGNSTGLDYIYVVKNSDDATIPATISAAGYATFSSAFALDLTSANTPSGLTAYYIDKNDLTSDNAPFTAIDQTVAAGQGILFKGAAGTYNIKVAASGTALADNALVATDGSAIDAGNYVFAYETENPSTTAGFYYLDANTTVAAGKAYLDGSKVPTVGEVKAFLFNDTVTGIDATAAVEEAEEDVVLYNTAGQVVTKDYKGIVIKNGKKYLNK